MRGKRILLLMLALTLVGAGAGSGGFGNQGRDHLGHGIQRGQVDPGHAPFVPGESTVRYAGRVFGPPELRNAADAVLDFWLTAGRFSEEFRAGWASTWARATS